MCSNNTNIHAVFILVADMSNFSGRSTIACVGSYDNTRGSVNCVIKKHLANFKLIQEQQIYSIN